MRRTSETFEPWQISNLPFESAVPSKQIKNTASTAVFLFVSGRGERIRTFDILVPNQALYQTELHPETTAIITAFFTNANFSFIFFISFLSCTLMRKRILIFITFCAFASHAVATTRDATLTNTTGYNNNYMYPYMNNQMRTNLNPGVSTSQSLKPINTVVKTTQLATARRVVPRTNTSRAATTTSTNTSGISARVATTASATPQRNVVARRGNLRGNQQQTVIQNGTTDRSHPTYTNRTATEPAVSTTATESISSTRCLADYTECMNDYCERTNTAYNRCYCSSRLSQIDSEYQTSINNLIHQILTLQTTNNWTDAEMNEYWMSTVGKYSGENSWTNLENALDIDWASTESRVRGQTAFITGHEYCVQHLRGCSYMATNLRDAYRSEIARDCNAYEQSLQRIKTVAESIVESYSE